MHFWMLAGPFLLIYAQVVFNLYLIRRHLDDIIDTLPNSRYFYIWLKTLRNRVGTEGLFHYFDDSNATIP